MKRIVLTKRDNEIIEFLKEYKCATSSSIANLFFNGSIRPCNRRLQYLRENNLIKSSQEHISLEKVHYLNKLPKQLKHTTIVSNFISKLYCEDIEILKVKLEYKIGNIRSDILVICKIKGKLKIFSVEVCNTKGLDLNKYIRLKESGIYKDILPVFPTIISISNKDYNSKYLDIINLNLNLDDFIKIKD